MRLSASTVGFLLLLTGCDVEAPEDEPECDGETHVAVISQVPEVVDSDLLVRGTARTDRNVAIRSVAVEGTEAKPTTFNFGEWEAAVPFAALLALGGDASARDDVMLRIQATPACGKAATSTLPVHLNRRPGIRVSELSMQVIPPANRTFLPADGSASGVLQIDANAEARGAVVALEATADVFPGSTSSLKLTLPGDGMSGASTMVLLTATSPGTVFLTATAQSFPAKPVSFVTAAAPRLLPGSASLRPGQTLQVFVAKDTAVQTTDCKHSGDAGIAVVGEASAQTFELRVAEDLASPAEVTLSCRDGYGQEASATYDAAPVEPSFKLDRE